MTCLQVLQKSFIVAAEGRTDSELACGVQVACILLPLCFLYDIFWVFITPLIMGGKSVMVEVSECSDSSHTSSKAHAQSCPVSDLFSKLNTGASAHAEKSGLVTRSTQMLYDMDSPAGQRQVARMLQLHDMPVCLALREAELIGIVCRWQEGVTRMRCCPCC